MRLFCNCLVVIGEDMNRINYTPQFLHFKNQQTSLDNHQSIAGKTAGTVLISPSPFASLRETQDPAQQSRAAKRLLLAMALRGFAGLDAMFSDFIS
jgi:hypothetical protein